MALATQVQTFYDRSGSLTAHITHVFFPHIFPT